MKKEELEKLVLEGKSIRSIAVSLECSAGTVRYWLKKFQLITNPISIPSDLEAASLARSGGGHLNRICQKHGETMHYIPKGKYGKTTCCVCIQEYQTNKKNYIKENLVNKLGGCCTTCGYSKTLDALEFHHLNPQEKLFGLTKKNLISNSLDKVLLEVDKCVLLCTNCHAIEEQKVSNKRYETLYQEPPKGYKEKICHIHGAVSHYKVNNQCSICHSENVAKYRRSLKQKLVDLLGGSCKKCGFDKDCAALHFHHLDPSTKEFGIGNRPLNKKNFETIKKEVLKCELLCGNCHAEIHSESN